MSAEAKLPSRALARRSAPLALRGKVRLRNKTLGQKCEWRDYQAARLSGVFYGATFRRKEELTAWINSQILTNPLICLGDGHSGVWNLFSQITTTQQRHEILDWFHLKENLFKVGGSLKRLRQGETLLWKGKVFQAIALFKKECPKRARKFLAYVKKHRHRLPNYELLQTEYQISIGEECSRISHQTNRSPFKNFRGAVEC